MTPEVRIPGEWAELTEGQARFFAGQLAAAKEIVFSPTALELGITPVRSVTYSFQHMGERSPVRQAFLWQDPHAPSASCVIMGDNTPSYPSKTAFALITGHADGSYSAEGVAVGFGYSNSNGANLYGRVVLGLGEIPPGANHSHIGPYFFQAAVEASADFENAAKIHPEAGGIEIVGAESRRLARLFRSLSSLYNNLIVGGVPPEQWGFGSQTYDLARTLLKTSMLSAVNHPEEGSDQPSLIQSGATPGTVFESERYGLVIISRTGDHPDSIALTIVPRPHVDEKNVYAERYTISAVGATFDAAILPAEVYAPSHTAGISHLLSANPKENDGTVADLQEPERIRLEEKIIHLLAERNQVSKQHNSS